MLSFSNKFADKSFTISETFSFYIIFKEVSVKCQIGAMASTLEFLKLLSIDNNGRLMMKTSVVFLECLYAMNTAKLVT